MKILLTNDDGYDALNADKKLVMPGGIEEHCHIAVSYTHLTLPPKRIV